MIMVHAVVARRDVCESLRGRLVARDVLGLICAGLRERAEVDHVGGRVAQSAAMLLVCTVDDLADPSDWVRARIAEILHDHKLATAWSAPACRRLTPALTPALSANDTLRELALV